MSSTQSFLQFDRVRDGAVVLRGGDLRAILRVLPVNFGLKSQEEQDAITYTFQNFLNSLDFDLQIVIHSQKMNIAPYLEDLKKRAENQDNELLRTQTEEYAEFIRSFVENTNIMTKQFYVVIPFSLQAKQKVGGILSTIPSFLTKKSTTHLNDVQFSAARTQLLQRVEFIAQGLTQLGLRSTILSTEEIITLFWRLYNPEHQNAAGVPEIPSEILSSRSL